MSNKPKKREPLRRSPPAKRGKSASDAGKKAGEKLDFQVHGPITSVDQAAQTFVIRGQTVSYSGSVTYTGGDASGIAVGNRLFVQGTLSADGATVQAVAIRYGENSFGG